MLSRRQQRTLRTTVLAVFVISGCLSLLAMVSERRKAYAFSGGPPAGYTGAPGESDCSQCHALDAGVGTFQIIAPANYSPGNTYQILVRHDTTDNSRRRWGFELTALAGTTAAGTFQSANANTQTLSGNNRRYIEHSLAGTFAGQTGGASWTFLWTAPSSNVGDIKFYAAGNQANNNNNPDGDQVYFATASAVHSAMQPFASIAGRVLSSSGRGVADATVSAVDDQGNRILKRTNPFGFYRFAALATGRVYTVSTSSKRFTFAPRSISLSNENVELDIKAQ